MPRLSALIGKRTIDPMRVAADVLLGKVLQQQRLGIDRTPCVLVRCKRNEFNTYLKMYFQRSEDFWAIDKTEVSNIGDTVLIQSVEEKHRLTNTVKHAVDRIVYKFGFAIFLAKQMQKGAIVDPVTNRPVVGDQLADERTLKGELVKYIVDEPLEQDALMFEERRAVQRQRLDERKIQVDEPTP